MPDDERVAEELEAVQAILMDEISVKRDEKGFAYKVETDIHPWTASNTDKAFVRVTLDIELPNGYPDVEPKVKFRNPRGLDDSLLNKISSKVKRKCKDSLGQPVIFELIEIVKEHLTEANIPSCECCICLYGFRQGDEFTKTHCYHYFHSNCLGSHLIASEKIFKEEQDKLPPWQQTNTFQAVCPVCRASIDYNIENLLSCKPPQDLTEAPGSFKPDKELRELQHKMSQLLDYQKKRGGVIQLENKTLTLLSNSDEPVGNRR